MTWIFPRFFVRAVSLVLVTAVLLSAGRAEVQPLWTLDPEMDWARIETRDVRLVIGRREEQPVLELVAGHERRWPGITILPAAGAWDLSTREAVSVSVRNTGTHSVEVGLRADSPRAEGGSFTLQTVEPLSPGQTRRIRLPLRRRMPAALQDRLFGMRGYPERWLPDGGIEVSEVTAILIFISQPDREHRLELADLQASGDDPGAVRLADPEELFPMIDRFGQYRHRDWPGKTGDESDLREWIAREDRDLAAHPGPEGRNRFGGWRDGPQLEATGHFRVVQREGTWWLVDPEGRLFWSHGINCVRVTNGVTPITDREFYFADLPPDDSPLAEFYGWGSWAPRGYYHGRGRYRTFNFTGSNLQRKYGESWFPVFSERVHQRLRSWGLNTIANWSDPVIYGLEQTPYVVTVSSGGPRLEGSTGYWGQFPDPFDPEFRRITQRNMAARQDAANSPWCLGVFIDNELAWGQELSLALATLASPADQAAKQAFLEDLREKYQTVDQLNRAWGTRHDSWEALAEHREAPPIQEQARPDLEAFATRLADQYFQVCREAVRQTAPHTLYLGCRFAWVNDRAIRSAARYCDVLSFNLYRDSVAEFRLPDGVNAPVLIGEFHFGALDRGMFHTGLRATANQEERAEAYRNYVRGAIRNPWLVGTHWFQFGDQATTGRGDGENYQIGFLDICDTPYPEIIRASRQIGEAMYGWR